jgi:uncharacterized protein
VARFAIGNLRRSAGQSVRGAEREQHDAPWRGTRQDRPAGRRAGATAGATATTGAPAAPAAVLADGPAGGATTPGLVARGPGDAGGGADANARQWAMLAHLSALFGLIIGLNWLGPLVVYLVKKDEHPFIADQGREALNFNLSVFIYVLVSVVLIFIVIGFLLLPVIGIAWLVLTIIAGIRANNGEPYRYPLTIKFVS